MTVLSLGLLAQYFFSPLIIPILISFIQCFAKHLGTPCCVILNILLTAGHIALLPSLCPPSTSLFVLAQPTRAATHPCALGPAEAGCVS